MAKNLFDDYDDVEEKEVVLDETLSHLEKIKLVLEEAGLDYDETTDADSYAILKLKNGVALLFDESDALSDILGSYDE